MELCCSWEAANCAAIQELPNILCDPKIYYRVYKSTHLVPIMSHINPVHTTQSYLRSILILSTHLRLPIGLFPSGFPTNILYAFLFSPLRATCHAHHQNAKIITEIKSRLRFPKSLPFSHIRIAWFSIILFIKFTPIQKLRNCALPQTSQHVGDSAFFCKVIIHEMVEIAAGYMRPTNRVLITETINLQRLHYCVFHIWNSEIG
jgi:hypothetical protein